MMMRMTSEELDSLLKDFEPDGSLRDVVMLDWTLADWDAFLCWVRTAGRPFEFFIDGQASTLPPLAVDIFKIREVASPQLEIHIGRGLANCHFVDETFFELDIDPSDYHSTEAIQPLLSFITDLGRAMRRSIHITLENLHDRVLAVYDLDRDELAYVPWPRGE